MTVKELIDQLKDYNPDALIDVVVNYHAYQDISLGYESPDTNDENPYGKKDTTCVSIFVDDLNKNDNITYK